MESVAGKHVIEKIGEGVYALFARMQPGSLRVKLGEHVHRGQMLGLVCNSGKSTGPHLHFHLCDSNAAPHCEGIPYAIRSFQLRGVGRPKAIPSPAKRSFRPKEKS